MLQALDSFNTAVVSPVYYVMFTILTIFANMIMYKVMYLLLSNSFKIVSANVIPVVFVSLRENALQISTDNGLKFRFKISEISAPTSKHKSPQNFLFFFSNICKFGQNSFKFSQNMLKVQIISVRKTRKSQNFQIFGNHRNFGGNRNCKPWY